MYLYVRSCVLIGEDEPVTDAADRYFFVTADYYYFLCQVNTHSFSYENSKCQDNEVSQIENRESFDEMKPHQDLIMQVLFFCCLLQINLFKLADFYW